jgi:hypothetical protein
MSPRYRAALALTLALTASLPADARSAAHRHAGRHKTGPGAAANAPISATDLYSRRALRRARIILELKLMELRKEHLERVRKAIEQHVPIDQLPQQ